MSSFAALCVEWTCLIASCVSFCREEPVRQHLRNVYACLTMATMAAAVGASVHLFTDILQAGFLSGLGALVFFGLLMATADDDGKKLQLRVLYLLGFAGLSKCLVVLILPSFLSTEAFLLHIRLPSDLFVHYIFLCAVG